MGNPGEMQGPRVLHVVVGHGLPGYFLNTVRSVRAAAPEDQVLVIDNASPQAGLRAALQRMVDEDPKIDLILRTSNELGDNRKVGGLYQAYTTAFDYAVAREFDLLHLLQGDFQLMWWDDDLVAESCDLFAAHPHCVNILMQFLSRDKKLTDDLAPAGGGLTKLKNYGLTDTGLYHLGRWRDLAMEFGPNEQAHARRYLGEGLEVLCHPWPTDAPIPWPAVIRNGIQRGREVVTGKPFLLKPLRAGDVAYLKAAASRVWLEDMCIPWGWACATPMWVSGLDSIDYWVLRYRDAKKNGLRHILPRLELRGVDGEGRRALMRAHRYRPPLFGLLALAPVRGITRGLRAKVRPLKGGLAHSKVLYRLASSPMVGYPLLLFWLKGWLPLPSGETAARLRDGRILLCQMADRTQRTMFLGLFEPGETRLVQSLLQPGDTFVDIGAHIGWFTTTAAQRIGEAGQVIAFEPYGANVEMLRKNVTLNGCENVRIVEMALGSRPGTLTLARAGGDSGGVTALDWATDGRAEVPVTTLDAVAGDLGDLAGAALIKIDVEGWEAHVLRGAEQTLARVQRVLIEINHAALRKAGSSPEELFTLLRAAGFVDFRLVQQSRFRRLYPSSVQNVLATRSG